MMCMVEQQDIKWITTNIEECQEKKYCNTKTQSLVPAKCISSGSKNNTTSELSDSVKCQARKKKTQNKVQETGLLPFREWSREYVVQNLLLYSKGKQTNFYAQYVNR